MLDILFFIVMGLATLGGVVGAAMGATLDNDRED